MGRVQQADFRQQKFVRQVRVPHHHPQPAVADNSATDRGEAPFTISHEAKMWRRLRRLSRRPAAFRTCQRKGTR